MFTLAYPYIDPILLDLPGPFAIRWYGVTYLIGFLFAFWVLRYLARTEFLKLPEDKISDLLVYQALGVFLGGRIGYVLFYNFQEFISSPSALFRVWEGGMSFHGGLIGVLLMTLYLRKRYGVTFTNLGDSYVLALPGGLTAVRIANFINGELYGRVTDASAPFAMRFPTDPIARKLLGAYNSGIERAEELTQKAYASGAWDQIKGQVPFRHPSQLYEAALEGVLLGLFLWAIFWLSKRGKVQFGSGFFGGLFLVGYALARFSVEFFRQPDPQFQNPGDTLGVVLGPLSMGQVLSALMIPLGAYFIWQGIRTKTHLEAK